MNQKTACSRAALAIVVAVVPAASSSAAAAATTPAPPATPATVPTIVVKEGQPVGGIAELNYNKGDQIHFKVDSPSKKRSTCTATT